MQFVRAGLFCTALFLFVLPNAALAHATPISYTPDAGATELTTPRSISVRFTERIEPEASSLTVFAPNGEEVNEGKGIQDPNDGRVFSVPIRDAGEGVYTVSWQVVSVDDGHFSKGAHSFLVDATGKAFEGNAGGVTVTYVTRFPEAVFNFFSLLGESIMLAGVVLLLFGLKRLYGGMSFPGSVWEDISLYFKHLFIFAFLFLSFGTITTFVRKVTELASLQSATFGETLGVFLGSQGGMYLALKFAVGVLFIAVFLLWRKRIMEGKGLAAFPLSVLACLAALIVQLQSSISHAAASLFHPALSIAVTTLHLLAKEFVIGGVVIMLVLLCAHLKKGITREFIELLPRFDLLVAVALIIAGASGVFISWLHLKRFEHFLDTEWGERFIVLLILTCALGTFRLLHQFIVHPRFGRSQRMTRLYLITLPAEATVGFAVLFFSGYISITTPPFIVEEFTYEVRKEADDVHVILGAHPYEKDTFRILIEDSVTGGMVPLNDLVVTATNRERGIGPNVLTVEERFPGAYTFDESSLSPAGQWNVEIIAERNGAYDAHASFGIRFPEDVLASRYSEETREFNGFARAHVILGLMIILFSLGLSAHAMRRIRKLSILPSEEPSVTASLSMAHAAGSALLIALVFSLSWGAYQVLAKTEFEKECLREGGIWRQAFPTRNFEAVSPNALNGCSVHDGHYHFVDEREFRAYMGSL